jgi:hypothetical protein
MATRRRVPSMRTAAMQHWLMLMHLVFHRLPWRAPADQKYWLRHRFQTRFTRFS